VTVERIRSMLDERPFRPFDIYTSDGKVVRVLGSDFAWVHPNQRTMYVCPDPNRDVDQVIDLLHVTKLAYPLPNGKGRKRRK
jgi:hypothetical protein